MKKIVYPIYLAILLISCAETSDGDFSLGSGDGVQVISGSTTGFAIVDDFLYVLNKDGLKVLSIATENPAQISTITITETAETIFQYENNLLIGTQSGMLIYNIDDPASPQFMSSVFHQTACDPVIAKDDIAYLTIREGLNCNNRAGVNRLIVVDISNLEGPVELEQISMLNPRGLTIFGDNLYVCEGDFGLKQFDISDKENPVFEKIYQNIESNDVIAVGETLIITGDDGISQYQIENDGLTLLSAFK